MRAAALVLLTALALWACQKAPKSTVAGGPAAGSSPSGFPPRKPGLWLEVMTRDGHPSPIGGPVKMCIDAATDAQMTAVGRHIGNGACDRKSGGRGLDGSYHFTVVCTIGPAGTTTSNGAASGDFSSKYKVRIDSETSGSSYGPANGHHVMDIEATYGGPCPGDMAPGDIVLGNGMKVNVMHPMHAGPAGPA